MTYYRNTREQFTNDFPTITGSELDRKIQQGLRRAPMERAKALREFWSWITRTS